MAGAGFRYGRQGRWRINGFQQWLTGHTDAAFAVATTVVDGRPVAMTGSADTTVRVWDVATPVSKPDHPLKATLRK
ncbi:hypothetical protein WKI71_43890 [Streptomyces sp. MS1.AVA.1]|uniref:Uncharacterized protein n=1 Tax=Streptomyces machairae TaxID=3134109 RepID=A0ABU8UW36_9ACTN